MVEIADKGTQVEAPNAKDVCVLPVTPAMIGNLDMARHMFDIVADHSKALVLIGYATGTTPSAINPFIRGLKEKGIPVFILSDNKNNHHGVLKIAYEPQAEAVEAGATPLLRPNINQQFEVVEHIQAAIDSGVVGDDLRKAIIDEYGMPTSEYPKSY